MWSVTWNDFQWSIRVPTDWFCFGCLNNIHIRGSLSTEVARCVAASIVGSRLDYCNGLLYGATAKNIHKLQLVQNTAARVVNLSRRRDHIKPVLKSLHWLPVNERITLKLATTVFKTLSCSEPPYLRELLNIYNPTRCLRSSQKQLLTVPGCRTSIASRAFSVTAPVLWNSIDADLKQSDSVATFKRNIKTRLFGSFFGWLVMWWFPRSVIRTCNTVWRLAC